MATKEEIKVVALPECTKSIKFHDALEEILAYIKGRVPIIWVQTHEEVRFIQAFVDQIATPTKRDVWIWSSFQGLLKYDNALAAPGVRASGEEADTWNAPKALNRITALIKQKDAKGQCFIMRDFHTSLAEPVPRQLRDIYEHLMANRKTLIITSPVLAHGPGGNSSGLPPTLEKQIAVVRFELPSAEQIHNRILEVINSMKQNVANAGLKVAKSRLEYTDEQLRECTRALQGLTMTEIDDAISTSMTHLHELNVQKLIASKKQLIRKSEILEFVETNITMDDVGGLDSAKMYLMKYALAHSDEAKAFGVEPLKGMILTGVPGCLAGGTIIPYHRGDRAGMRYTTLEKLYKKFNGLYKSWDHEIPTHFYSYNHANKLVMNRVVAITEAGIKETVCINATGNRYLELTHDHPVCKTDGVFVKAGELLIGDKVLVQGDMKPRKDGGRRIELRPERKVVETLKYHPFGSDHMVNGYTYQRINYARAVIEAHMNGLLPDDFIHILKTDIDKASRLKFLDPKYDVHHIDENPLNDDLGNLMVLEHDEHQRHHGMVENFHVNYLEEAEIVNVRQGPDQMTYDVQMDYPYNNFVADDFIVHNTGKSLLAKAIGSLWKLPLLRLDVGKVMTGLVGGSEGKMRDVIQQAESMAPCITGDTLVHTACYGDLPISELYNWIPYHSRYNYPEDNVEIYTRDEEGQPVESHIQSVIRRPAKDKKLLQITTESGKTIKVTENHKLLCQDKNGLSYWKEAKDLTTEDNLVELDS